MPTFAYSCQNRLPQQRPLSDLETKVGLIIPTHICTYPENLVTICPVLSEIIGLQGDRAKEREKNYMGRIALRYAEGSHAG